MKNLSKMKNLSFVIVAVIVQVIAASLCFAEGSVEYGGIILRNGGIVVKDFHDSFEGDGWISGVVVSNSTPTGTKPGGALLLVVRVAKSPSNGLKEDKLYNVVVDSNSKVFIAPPRSGSAGGQSGEKPAIADGIAAVSKFLKDQRVSIAFRKGTHVSERLVNEGYEIATRQEGYGLTGTSTGPAMPRFD
jgi:hypothetical protein